jgi:hypothetical protein
MSHGLKGLQEIAETINVLLRQQEVQEIRKQERIEAEEKARRDADEQARRDADEQARREEQERARREAEEQERRDADEQARRKLAITNLQSVSRRHSARRAFKDLSRTELERAGSTKIQSNLRGYLARRSLAREQEKIEQFDPLDPPISRKDQQYLFFRQKKYSNNEKFSFSVKSDQEFDIQKTSSETDGASVKRDTFNKLDDQQKLKTYQNKIDKALNLAISATKEQFKGDGQSDQSNIDLPEKFFVAVMQIASFNQGIGNCDPGKIKQQIASLLDLKTESNPDKIDQLYQASKFFSKTFQQNVEFYTGNTSDSAKRDTKMRLFRASTYENIERLFQRTCSSKSPDSALQLGVRTVGVEDQSNQLEFKKLFETNSSKLGVIGKATKTSIKARSALPLSRSRSLSTPPRSLPPRPRSLSPSIR